MHTLASLTTSLTQDQLYWAKLVLDHVRVGDFEGAIALIVRETSRPTLQHLSGLLLQDARTAGMDVSEVSTAISDQQARLLMH